MKNPLRLKSGFRQPAMPFSPARWLATRWFHGGQGQQKFGLILLLSVLPLFGLQAQTTYTWIGGASAAYGTATNWSPNRISAANTDILNFDPTQNSNITSTTLTGLPTTQTIGQIILSNGATVALQHTAASTLTLSGGTGTDLSVPSGCTLKLDNQPAATGTLTLTFTSGQGSTASIDGILALTGNGATVRNAFTATNAIVTINGTVENTGTITGSLTSLIFNEGSAYNHNFKTVSGTIPTANWNPSSLNPGSLVTIKGYTTNSTTPGGLSQNFADFTWNCPSQTASPGLNSTTMNVAGTFKLENTNIGTLRLSTGTASVITVKNYDQSGGTLDFYNGSTTSLVVTLKISGTCTQTGGTITETGSSTANAIMFNGSATQNVPFTATGLINSVGYAINNTSGITPASGSLTINDGAPLYISTPGSVIINGTVTYSGNNTLVYNSSTGPQTATALEFPATNGPTNLTLNNTFSPNGSNTVSLPGDRTLAGTITFTSGYLKLGGYNFTLQTSTSLGTYSGTACFIQDGTGRLKRVIQGLTTAQPGTKFIYPIAVYNSGGSLEYSGGSLSFTYNSQPRTITMGAFSGAHPQLNSNTPAPNNQTNYLNRYWHFDDDQTLNPAGIGTYTYGAGFRTYTADIQGKRSRVKINRWDTTLLTWTQVAGRLDTVTSPATPLFNLANPDGNGQPYSYTDQTACPIGGSEFTARENPSTTYTWNGSVVATPTDYQVAANWTPNRAFPADYDRLLFKTGTTVNVTNVPTQNIGQLIVSNNTTVNLAPAAVSNTLTFLGLKDADLNIGPGSTLALSGVGANSMNLTFAGIALNTDSIAGNLVLAPNSNTFDIGNSVATVTPTGKIDNSGTINGATATSLLLAAGATYIHNLDGGTIPTATYDPASNVIVTGIIGTAPTSFPASIGNLNWNCSGQTVADASIAGLTTVQGNLTITSTGSGSILLAPTLTVNGDLTQAAGTINLNNSTTTTASTLNLKKALNQTGGTITRNSTGTGAATIVFNNGTLNQAVNFGGVVTNKVNYNLNNAGGMTLGSTMPVNNGATLTISSGMLKLGNFDLTIGSTGNLSVPAPSASNMIVVNGTGQVKKSFAASATTNFIFHIGEESGTTEYSPVSLNFTNGATARTIGASVTNAMHSSMNTGNTPTDYLSRFWTFSDDQTGNDTYSYTGSFTYLPADVVTSDANMKASRWNGSAWNQAVSNAASNVLTITTALNNATGPLGGNAFTGRAVTASAFTWDGSTSSDWFDGTNWDQNSVPGVADNVIINNAAVTQPVISSTGGPVTINDLSLQAGSLMLGANSSITVGGTFTYATPATTNFDCTSTFTYASTNSQTIYALTYGNLVSGGAAARTFEPGTTTICGSFTPGPNAAGYTVSGSTIDFNGPGALIIPAFTFNNLKISGARGINNVAFENSIITIGGTFEVTNSFSTGTFMPGTSSVFMTSPSQQTIPAITFYDLNADGGNRIITGTLKIANSFNPGTGNYTVAGSTVEFTSNSAKTIPPIIGGYHNILISGSGEFSFGGGGVPYTHNLGGNFTQTAGTVNVNNSASATRTLNISGELNINGGAFRLIDVSTAVGATVNVGTNLNITGNGIINLESESSTSGVALLVVSGNFMANTTAANALDFGTGNVTNNEVRVAGNVDITGTKGIHVSSTSTTVGKPKGLVFNGSGIQILTSGAIHNFAPITVLATATLKLGSNLTIAGKVVSTKTWLTASGILDMAGYSITSDVNTAIIVANGGLIKTNGSGTYASIVNFGAHSVDAGGTLELEESQITGTGSTTINGTLKTAKAEGLSGGANTALASSGTISIGAGSTIEYNGAGTQTITDLSPATLSYSNLKSSSTGARILSGTGTVKIAETFTPGSNAYTVTGSTVEFNGAAQSIPAFNFNDLKISGTGDKTLMGNITVAGALTMSSSIIQTGTNKVVLGSAASVSETDVSYVNGNMESVSDMSVAGTYNFNGIGLSLAPQAGSSFPGLTTVRRVTGTPLAGPNSSKSIARYFEIVPTTNQNLNVAMVFSYLNHELNGIQESNLVLFKSATGTAPWTPKGYDTRDAVAKTVTLNGITDFSTWTLGDATAPLPVELVAFDAKKVGSDVEITWATASEKNSLGYEVQVSANGTEFRKLGFAESRNGSNMQQYRFTDSENGKTGIRYYRLKQIDLDGTVAYYGSKTVRFDAEKLQVSAYPNPFAGEINLKISALESGKAILKISDLTGKVVFEQAVNVLKGNNQLTIGLEKQLPAGAYLLQTQVGNNLITTRLLKQ